MEDLTTYEQSFGGIGRLFGQNNFTKLTHSHVVIVGIGGVGSWCAESLVRSGVGSVTLADPDDICITNTNRQLHTQATTIGKSKVEVMKNRLLAINPDLKIQTISEFITEKNIQQIIEIKPDYVVDAIDSIKNKVLLITTCLEHKIPIITTGGTAGKQDPAKLRLGDVGESFNDKLIMRVRKKLREHFNHPPTEKIFYGVECVFSTEQAVYPDGQGGVCHLTPKEENLRLDCYTGLGSASFVTGTAGFMAAAKVVQQICQK